MAARFRLNKSTNGMANPVGVESMDAEDLSNCKTLMADGLVIACHLDEMHELVLSNAKSAQSDGCFGF